MTILVSDTSVLIDLERGGLIDSCFGLEAEFAVPDLLYKRELAGYGGDALVARGLRIVELTSEELTAAQTVRTANPGLSLPDAFAFSLAASRAWTLLTGDGELRALARAERLSFVGVFWVLDQLFDGHIVDPAALVAGLGAIAAHPRCRLPRQEIFIRLERYGRG
jgi:hypothetical protein